MKRPWKPVTVVVLFFVGILAFGGCPDDREVYLRNFTMRKCAEQKAAYLLRIAHLERNNRNLEKDNRKLRGEINAD